MKSYNVPRKEAGEIAGISLRTLDRYVLSKKIEYKKVKGRVLFSEEDLKKIKVEKNTEEINNIQTSFNFKKDKTEHKVFKKDEKNKKTGDEDNINNLTKNFGENFGEMVKLVQVSAERDSFKKMFEITNSDLKEKQNQLEKANFKLGELLAKQNIPLLENKNKSEKILKLEQQLEESDEIHKGLENEITFQKFIKTIFIIILLLTISILSFWYVYNFKI